MTEITMGQTKEAVAKTALRSADPTITGGRKTMDVTVISRRRALLGAATGAGVIGGLGVLGPATAKAAGDDSRGIVGAWNLTVVDHERGETIRAMIAFNAGGGVAGLDDSGGPSVGAWSDVGDREFRFSLFQFVADPQVGKLYFTIKGHGHFGAADSVSGTSTVTVVDSQGNILFQSSAPQTFTGGRIRA